MGFAVTLPEWLCCQFYKQYIMRGIIHDQVSRTFIEGPVQSNPADGNSQEGTADKAYYADLTQGHPLQGDAKPHVSDTDMPYYEEN